MKTTTLFLGLFAFILAIGSAFATLYSADANPSIKVKYTSSDPDWTCVQTQALCDNAFGQACTISVSTLAGNENVRGKIAGCSANMNNDEITALDDGLSQTFYDATSD